MKSQFGLWVLIWVRTRVSLDNETTTALAWVRENWVIWVRFGPKMI
jgi:hypothetical protein